MSRLREPFGTAGLVVAIVALLFALSGGAWALTASTSGHHKNHKKAKSKKGPRGPRGKTGAAGPAGPQGPAGANGKDGANGSNGAKGDKGEKGDQGIQGVKGDKGDQGDPGPEGSPWTDGGTLPAGATEAGTYGAQTSVESGEYGIFVPISFPIPISDATASASTNHVEYGPNEPPQVEITPAQEEFFENCPGTYQHPKALPGRLCIFGSPTAPEYNTSFIGVVTSPLAGTHFIGAAGTFLEYAPNGASELAVVSGSFAVTGCTEAVGDPNECP